MSCLINFENGISNRGNLFRMKQLMKRAADGEHLTIGFIGGSITQGAKASDIKLCYAYHVYEWWVKSFPKAGFTWVNAGIGATTSHYAAARVQDDLLDRKPDFVIAEFSVNDESNDHFQETYEGLIRQILLSKWNPAVMLVHNVFYDTGSNAQVRHSRIGRHYDLPSVSMQSSIYPEIVSGRLDPRTITEDDLHPNDAGHELAASVITYYLEKIKADSALLSDQDPVIPEPMTRNAYEQCKRVNNKNAKPLLEGFVKDDTVQKNLADCFRNGWMADRAGARIVFEEECTGVSVIYRRSVKKPAPIARVMIDGNMEDSVLLDGNFQETWGDKLELEMIMEHEKKALHKIEIILETVSADNAVPFYLGGLIVTM